MIKRVFKVIFKYITKDKISPIFLTEMTDTEWKSSEVVTIGSNKFQSHLTDINNINDIKYKLDKLIANNKKILKASQKHIRLL